jgi:hypothetical protein
VWLVGPYIITKEQEGSRGRNSPEVVVRSVRRKHLRYTPMSRSQSEMVYLKFDSRKGALSHDKPQPRKFSK